MDEEFELALEDVFGEGATKFSPVLKTQLRNLWLRGVEAGAYARNEKKQLPQEVVIPVRTERAKGVRWEKKVAEATAVRDQLVEKADLVSVRLESAIDPHKLENLEGDTLTKAVHRYLTHTSRIDSKLVDVLLEIDRFRLL